MSDTPPDSRFGNRLLCIACRGRVRLLSDERVAVGNGSDGSRHLMCHSLGRVSWDMPSLGGTLFAALSAVLVFGGDSGLALEKRGQMSQG